MNDIQQYNFDQITDKPFWIQNYAGGLTRCVFRAGPPQEYNQNCYYHPNGYYLDCGIAELIDLLNSKGFTTRSSCSGLDEDHRDNPSDGYISFIEPIKFTIPQKARLDGLVLRQKRGISDAEKKEMWAELLETIKHMQTPTDLDTEAQRTNKMMLPYFQGAYKMMQSEHWNESRVQEFISDMADTYRKLISEPQATQ